MTVGIKVFGGQLLSESIFMSPSIDNRDTAKHNMTRWGDRLQRCRHRWSVGVGGLSVGYVCSCHVVRMTGPVNHEDL